MFYHQILLYLFRDFWWRWILSTTESPTDSKGYCEDDFLKKQRIQSKITTVVLAIFFVSLLGVGMGQTAVYTLGIPYIDDNVASRESPLYFGKFFDRSANYFYTLYKNIHLYFYWSILDSIIRYCIVCHILPMWSVNISTFANLHIK